MAGGSEPVGGSHFQPQALRLFPPMPCGRKIRRDLNENFIILVNIVPEDGQPAWPEMLSEHPEHGLGEDCRFFSDPV